MSSNALTFASKIRFLTGLEIEPIDSAEATILITTTVDSAYVQLRSDAGGVDSASVSAIVTSTADSAYVQARQDFAYSSLTGTPTFDSAYVQARQDYSYASLTGAPNVLDSADITVLIDGSTQVLDIADIVGATGNSGEYLKSLGDGSAAWENITTVIDSAYVQARSSAGGVDSASVSSLITATVDSAYVQLRQDYSYASLTGTPNILDSALTTSIITTTVDSAYVQLRQDYSYASLTGTPNILDSADVVLIASSVGLDSALTTSLITTTVDSAYVQLRQDYSYASLTGTPNILDSALTTSIITTTVDSAYVQLRSGAGGLSPWVEKTSDYNLVAGDRIVVDTRDSAITLTLPASPSFSDEISIVDGTNYAATNNITVGRNGKKILASDSDFIINVDRASIEFMFYNDSQGWILTRTV